MKRLHENLPYPLKDVLMCNLYLDKNSQKVLKGESLKKEVIKERQQDSKEDIFVFAGFLKPGKHQIFIKDPVTDAIYGRDLVIDIRRREIDCRKYHRP